MPGRLVGTQLLLLPLSRPKPYFDSRNDTIELQREYVDTLRNDLKSSDTFRQVYNFTFDYAKNEGQKSMSESTFLRPLRLATDSTCSVGCCERPLDASRPVGSDRKLFRRASRMVDRFPSAAWEQSSLEGYVDTRQFFSVRLLSSWPDPENNSFSSLRGQSTQNSRSTTRKVRWVLSLVFHGVNLTALTAAAWPSVIDDFVDFARSKLSQRRMDLCT